MDFDEATGFHGILGRSEKMRTMFDHIRRVAGTQEPVLITGESGVGKELVARAIHLESDRRRRPFIAVNGASLPKELMESELFGYRRGAFTGALSDRKGLFAEAEGGTLFLDEIGELQGELQAKLLRVLQERAYRPVGGAEEVPADVRVLAATNRDLEVELREGRFRDDLYYRLETFVIHVAPLRERPEDLDLLVEQFLREYVVETGQPAPRVGEDILKLLRGYDFPGNVRELHSVLRRGLLYTSAEGVLASTHLPERILKGAPPAIGSGGDDDFVVPCGNGRSVPKLEVIRDLYVRWVLKKTGGNKKRAADILGIGRRTLYDYLREIDE